MAEQKTQGWFGKLIGWFVKLPGRIAKAFKNMFAELRKVTWPSKKKLISSCITVLVFMLLVGAAISVLDFASNIAVNGLYDLGHPTTAATEVVEEVVEDVNEDVTETEGEVVTDGEADPVVEEPAAE